MQQVEVRTGRVVGQDHTGGRDVELGTSSTALVPTYCLFTYVESDQSTRELTDNR